GGAGLQPLGAGGTVAHVAATGTLVAAGPGVAVVMAVDPDSIGCRACPARTPGLARAGGPQRSAARQLVVAAGPCRRSRRRAGGLQPRSALAGADVRDRPGPGAPAPVSGGGPYLPAHHRPAQTLQGCRAPGRVAAY